MKGNTNAQPNDTSKKWIDFNIIVMSAGVGIARGVIGFPLEQPLESIKT